jgi:8-oxo-dGTP diphosphatase
MQYKPVKATVMGIITKPGSRGIEILLTRRSIEPFKDRWCIPGGHIEAGEKARDAAVREIKEETGLDWDAQFFTYSDEIFPDIDFYAVAGVFTAEGKGELKPQESEVKECRWFSLDEALKLDLAFNHNRVLKDYSANSKKQ